MRSCPNARQALFRGGRRAGFRCPVGDVRPATRQVASEWRALDRGQGPGLRSGVRRLLLATLCLAPAPALAQRVPDICADGRISYVHLDNASIFDVSDPNLDRRFGWAYRAANALHVRTRDWVLRRELLFAPGDCFDQFLADESERLLRGYSFLSEVDIYPVPLPDSTVQVIVDTRDEWSTRVDVRLGTRRGLTLEGLRLTEDNLLGTGQTVGAFFFEREVTREYGLLYHTPQVLGTRWDLHAEFGRTRPGSFVRQEISYPYVGEVSRWAGRQSFRREDRFFDYITTDNPPLDSPHVLQPVREKSFDAALVRRFGRPGELAILGAAITYGQLAYPGPPEIAPGGDYDNREPADDSTRVTLLPQSQALDNIRAFALLGYRSAFWVRRRGLDSMRGQEDIRLGAEAGLAVGRSLPSLEKDDDLFTTLTLYTGMEAGSALVVGHARLDARRDLGVQTEASEWEDVYLDGELLAYLKPGARAPSPSRHTLLFRLAGFGGWQTRTPFQLTLGGERAVRGFDPDRYPGGRRLVASLEDRIYFGWPLPDLLDLGGSAFLDAGRIWAGDAPYGGDSGWKAAVGLGLRASFPAGGRSTYRLDFAWPLERNTGLGDFRVSVSLGEVIGLQTRITDEQIDRSRPQGVAGGLFPFR